MAVTERKASVAWEGDYRIGSGTVQPASAAFGGLPISFGERIESESRQTSPEELIASAAAASYALTLSNTLSVQGNQPDRLDVTAACHIDRTQDGLAITRMELDVKAVVPRLEADRFQELAQKAEQKCLVSNALRGNVEVALTAELLTDQPTGSP
jgi:osmotically inducible protein OsmC